MKLTTALVCIPLLATPVDAQILMGTLRDPESGRGVQDAEVRLHAPGGGVRESVSTDGAGRFFIRSSFLLPQDFLMVEALGYETQLIHLGDMPSFSPLGMEVGIDALPRPLAVRGVVASVRGEALVPKLVMSGFYERQRSSFGEFVTVDEVERDRARVPSDLLRGVQGVRFDSRGWGAGIEPRLGRVDMGGEICYPSVWVDGALARRAGRSDDRGVGAAAFDQLLDAHDVLAVEVYSSPAQLPPQYGGREGRCGVILVWTRDPAR